MTQNPSASARPAVRAVASAGEWDGFVEGSLKPHVMQTWGWGELKSRSGWRAHRLLVERGGRPRAGLSLLERDFPKIGRRFFYASRGPLAAEGWVPEDFRALFDEVDALASDRGAVFAKIDPDVSAGADWVTPLLSGAGFRTAPSAGGFAGVQPRCVFRLDVSRSEDELLKGMEQKTRYNIRVAEKKGVRIRPAESDADLESFYRVLVETARRDGFMIRSIEYFRHIRELLAGRARFFLAEADGKTLGGALAATCGPVAWYLYGASSTADRQYMPNHLMQWTLIRWAKSQGCRLYDFRAVPCDAAEGHPLYGLYRFKKGFGGEMTTFVGEFDRVYSPALYALWTRGWPLFKGLRKLLRRGPSAAAPDAA